MKWICIIDELPPKDGQYLVTNNPGSKISAIAEYDGYGFLDDGLYIQINFWKPVDQQEKRYGPQKWHG
jgi:hypothetical protein